MYAGIVFLDCLYFVRLFSLLRGKIQKKADVGTKNNFFLKVDKMFISISIYDTTC